MHLPQFDRHADDGTDNQPLAVNFNPLPMLINGYCSQKKTMIELRTRPNVTTLRSEEHRLGLLSSIRLRDGWDEWQAISYKTERKCDMARLWGQTAKCGERIGGDEKLSRVAHNVFLFCSLLIQQPGPHLLEVNKSRKRESLTES